MTALHHMKFAACLLGGSALIAGALAVTPPAAKSADGAVAASAAPNGASSLASPAAATKPRSKAPARQRPNIVLILVDDMALGDLDSMPNVKSLIGDQGTTFTRAISAYSLCCPARASILTGQYAHNHKVLGNEQPLGGFFAFKDKKTLPVWLQAAGYRTMMMGKYLNDYEQKPKYVPPGWAGWAGLNGRTYTYDSPRFNFNGKNLSVPGVYQTDYMSAMAQNRIRLSAPSRKPFFMWVSFVAPHNGGPRTDNDTIDVNSPYVAEEYRNTFAGTPQPRTANFNEDDVSDKPPLVAGRPNFDPDYATELWQQRQEALQSVDKSVAAIVAQLQATGELNNTVLAFASDNGYFVGEHRLEGKILPYEEALRVPLLIRGPGFPAGLKVRQQTMLADIAPTFVRTARARATLTMDGVALQRLAANPNLLANRPIVVEAAPTAGMLANGAPMDGRHRWFTGVRTASNQQLVTYAGGFREYYDMRDDPYQLRNRADAPATQDDVARLQALLNAVKNCKGSTCIRPPV